MRRQTVELKAELRTKAELAKAEVEERIWQECENLVKRRRDTMLQCPVLVSMIRRGDWLLPMKVYSFHCYCQILSLRRSTIIVGTIWFEKKCKWISRPMRIRY